MIPLLAAAFIFGADPALAAPRVHHVVRYRIRKKRAPKYPVAPPSSSQASVAEPDIKLVRVIPIIRPGATTWALWLDRIDPATDARARAAVRELITHGSFHRE